MPLVTAIKQQQKRSDRYSIFVDGRYALSLSEEQLLAEQLKVEVELSRDDINRLARQSEFGKVMDRCYGFISLRPRSTYEIVQYLRRKGCDEDMAPAVIERLTEQKLLNDTDFAQQWVRERREFGLHSIQRVRHELRAKGIDTQTIEEVISNQGDVSEQQLLRQLIEQKNLRKRYPEEPKLIQFLQRKGFRYGDIKAALEQLLET